MKEKSLNILIYLWLHNWTMHRNLAKFNSYHWLIPNFLSLSLAFFLSLCLSLRAPSSLVHDHLQSCCSCCCQIWACRQPPQAHQSFIIDTQACMQYKHTHTHTQTNYYNMHTRARDQQSWIDTRCTLVHKRTDKNGSVQYGYCPITHCMKHPANVAGCPLDKSSPDIYYIFCCLLTIFVPP